MLEKRVVACAFLGVFFLLSASLASAVGVSLTNIDSSTATVRISGVTDLYAYEVALDYTGSINSVVFSDYLKPDAIATSKGNIEKGSVTYEYESRLDNQKRGVSGAGTLFNVSHSGTLTLRYATFVYNDSTAETIYYNVSSGTVTPPAATETSGGGGGGGTPAKLQPIKPDEEISVDTSEMTLYLVLNSNKERIVRVVNLGATSKTILISQTGLDDLLMIRDANISLSPGESKDLRFKFVAPDKTGIYTGKIWIDGKEVLVSANVQTKELLFDAMISVPEGQKSIDFGAKLDTQITLIPMGESPRVDVTLNYLIKDFEGRTYLEESETILVEGQKNFKKEFYTGNLPVGNYVVGLEVVYPNGVAISSSHFAITKKKGFFDTRNIFIMVGIILGVLIIVTGMFLLRYRKHRAEMLLKLRRKR